MKIAAASALVLLAALALTACGSGGGDTTASTSAAQPGAGPSSASGGEQGARGRSQGQGSGQGQGGQVQGGAKHAVPGDTSAHFTPPAHHDAASGAAQFEAKGGDNSIQEFGAEAGSSDFTAAATTLHGYLDARAAGAWRDACSYLSPGVAASLSQLSGGSGGGASCPEAVASLSAAVPAATLNEAADAEVAALRSEGDRAFLLFHGAHGADYFMPMAHEGGAWKVAAIAPSALR